jgi:hypothetical protein
MKQKLKGDLMKKFIVFALITMFVLPLLFTGTAFAALEAPTNFRAYGYGDHIELEWDYSTYSRGNTLKFAVSSYDFKTLSWKEIGTVDYPTKSASVSTTQYGRHVYKVRAKEISQSQTIYSDYSNTDEAYLLQKPSALTVSINKLGPPTFKGDNSVTIKWDKITSPFPTSIVVYRKTEQESKYQPIAKLDSTAVSYKDTGAKPNTKYFYGVLAIRKDPNGKADDMSSLTHIDTPVLTLPPAPQNFKAVGKGKDIILTWTRVKECNGIKVFEQESALKWSLMGKLNKAVVQYTLKSTPYGKHIFQVVSYNASGNSPDTSIKTAYVLKAPHIKTITATSSDEVRIYYSQLDPNAPEITTYYSKNGKIFTSIGATKMKPDSTYIRVTGLMPSTKYYFEIAATRGENVSSASNALSVTTPAPNTLPKVPTNPKATLTNDGKVLLTWKDNANNEEGFKVERKKQNDSDYKVIATLPTDISETKYTDGTVEGGTTYYYRVVAYNSKGEAPSKAVSITTQSTAAQKVVMQLQPDNEMMVVNGEQKEIDPGRETKPVIIKEWGRTVVPIRAIVEALGGTIEWDGVERKVTIQFNGTTIELWIDNPHAKVNGVAKWIDENNHDVKPIIVNSRTMLPLRFVAESLGCKVDWDPTTRTITITYPAP